MGPIPFICGEGIFLYPCVGLMGVMGGYEREKYFVKNKQENLFLFVIFFNFIQSKFMLLDSCCF